MLAFRTVTYCTENEETPTKELISTTFQPFPLYLAAAAIYWVLSLSFEQIQRWMEKRVAYPY